MEKNSEDSAKSTTIIDFLKSKHFIKPLIAVFIGGIGGFLYYYFVGCNSGACAMTSNPYSSIIMGGLLGLFMVNSPCARGRC
jgi:hypothetical protein